MRHLVNPLLDCPAWSSSNSQIFLYRPLRKNIETMIANATKEGKILEASVYFRDLNNGPWFGINEDAPVRLGSLLKVPLVMGYLKAAETRASLLSVRLALNDPSQLKLYDVQGIKSEKKLEVGKTYTIEELLKRSIIFSDNVAAALLEKYDDHRALLQIASETDIPVRVGVPPWRPITLNEYAGFFRILYNSSFLNRENSNRLLSWLTRTTFREGLVGGVTEGVIVAHKFGEALADDKSTLNFTDCGIVYAPNFPYLVCISVRGKQELDLVSAIKKVSSLLYKFATSQDRF
ncbi:MAG: serine hydrolase [Deltaproteobacteria bacterium]|nr:serine hydrolase [Deltaproteobacteria bacterium]